MRYDHDVQTLTSDCAIGIAGVFGAMMWLKTFSTYLVLNAGFDVLFQVSSSYDVRILDCCTTS